MSRIKECIYALGCFSVSLMIVGWANITPEASALVFNWGLALLVISILLYLFNWKFMGK